MKVDSNWKQFMDRMENEHPEFYHHIQQGNPVGQKFKDYHPNQNITLSELDELDKNFIFNDPIDE